MGKKVGWVVCLVWGTRRGKGREEIGACRAHLATKRLIRSLPPAFASRPNIDVTPYTISPRLFYWGALPPDSNTMLSLALGLLEYETRRPWIPSNPSKALLPSNRATPFSIIICTGLLLLWLLLMLRLLSVVVKERGGGGGGGKINVVVWLREESRSGGISEYRDCGTHLIYLFMVAVLSSSIRGLQLFS